MEGRGNRSELSSVYIKWLWGKQASLVGALLGRKRSQDRKGQVFIQKSVKG